MIRLRTAVRGPVADPARRNRSLAARSGLVLLVVSAVAGVVGVAGEPTRASTVEEAPDITWQRTISSFEDITKRRGLLRRLTGRQSRELFLRPYDVAFTDLGLVVTDPAAHRVVLLSDSNGLLTSPKNLFESPIGVAECGGDVLVTDSRKGAVAMLTPELQLRRWLALGLARPTGIACTGDHVVISETGAHRLIVLHGADQRRMIGQRGEGPAEFNFPTAVEIAGRRLWVADTLNFRIQQLDLETGEHENSFGQLGDAPGEMPRVKGLAVDAMGRLWISDGLLNTVVLYSDSGRFLATLGLEGSRPTEFSFPAGIAGDADGRIVVVDSLNRRLQVFSLSAGRQDLDSP